MKKHNQEKHFNIQLMDILICFLPVIGFLVLSTLIILFLNAWFYGEDSVEVIAEINKISTIIMGGGIVVGSIFTAHSLFKLLRNPEKYYREILNLDSSNRRDVAAKRNSEQGKSEDNTEL